MWIQSVKLKNFKSYEDAVFRFPKPENGRNIVLIGALNGHGKTTLLEAVYLCLYGADAVSHLKRAGLGVTSGYLDFLRAALFHQAQVRRNQKMMELEIEIAQEYRGVEYVLKVRRKFYFDYNGKPEPQDNELHIELGKNGHYEPVPEAEFEKYRNAYALPIDYAPFFFFDGEKIVQTAEKSGAGTWLNSALKGLLGVTLLEKLRESITQYRNQQISSKASERLKEELVRAEKALQAAETALFLMQEEFQAVEADLNEWLAKRESLQNRLGGGSDIKTSQDLIDARARLDQQIDEFNQKIKDAVKSMPLAFLPQQELAALGEQLEREKNRLNHEAGKKQIESKVDDFWQTFSTSDKVREALGRMAEPILQDDLMQQAVRECWDNLFYPLPENCAETVEHNYLSVNIHAEIQNEIAQSAQLPQEKIGSLMAELARKDEERKEISVKIEALRGTDNDELVEQLKEAQAKTDEYQARYGALRNNVMERETAFKSRSKEVQELQDRISSQSPGLVKSERAGTVLKVIADLTDKLMAQKVQAVGEAATRINREIAHDQRIERIRIESNGELSLFGRDGRKAAVDFSAGQMQILIMSLVSALAEVTRYQAPLIIDTPLARLDEGHREGLFRHWSGLTQQVILLSQNTEITPEVYRRLKTHIGCTYLVEAESLDSAGARSRVTKNAYFEH
ncbi:MAG: AAA family ATPase [Neisseria sp.]|nr:AAA family ATPase [Neisseria sp.]